MESMIDDFFTSSLAQAWTCLVLGTIALLVWRGTGRHVVLGLAALFYVRYILWRALFSLNLESPLTTTLSLVVLGAETYGLIQFFFMAYQAWSPTDRQPVPLQQHPMVDIFVTVYNEPAYLLRRTLIACQQQAYPTNRFKVWVLDDGPREEVRALATRFGCGYLQRPDRRDAKAGNLNHALAHTEGEFIAVFDVDHVPVRTFLAETVGSFDDKQVAFVQTPQHFYNPDVFQKNLRTDQQVLNEQVLFFRTLQPGRDATNSAFFAGSSGLFRRTALAAIGGFQTETLTEDLHTSLVLHAKGYESRYLNKVLSAGRMPETFASYLKQRARWAAGAVQTLFAANPLSVPGLTVSQRINYFAAIYYFFCGLPRIICLVAPLVGLFGGVYAVNAATGDLVFLFVSTWMAVVTATWFISRGRRDAFWSDLYETAVCFSMSWAVLKTIVWPCKEQRFVVTPKGESEDSPWHSQLRSLLPHLLVGGALCVGLILGAYRWMTEGLVPGMGITLFWAVTNVLLLGAVFVTGRELPARREFLRLSPQLSCEVRGRETVAHGVTTDLSERGVCLHLSAPLYDTRGFVTITMASCQGTSVRVKGRIQRQELHPDGGVELGIQFADVDDETVTALIAECFSAPESWDGPEPVGIPIWTSLVTLLRGFAALAEATAPRRRRFPRLAVTTPCRLQYGGVEHAGTTRDVAYDGLCVELPGTHGITGSLAMVDLEATTLKVRVVAAVPARNRTILHLEVESIEAGEAAWQQRHAELWQASQRVAVETAHARDHSFYGIL